MNEKKNENEDFKSGFINGGAKRGDINQMKFIIIITFVQRR